MTWVSANAWVVNSSLIVLGVLLVGVAVAFYRVVRPEATKTHRSATAISLGVVGVGFASADVSYERTGGPAPVGQFGGLIERVLFVVILGWYVLLGWRLLRTPPEGHDAEARS